MRLKEKGKLVDEFIDVVQSSKVIESNKLIKYQVLVITQIFKIKKMLNNKKEEPFQKRRSKSNINPLYKDVSLIERWKAGMLRDKSHTRRLGHFYQVKKSS